MVVFNENLSNKGINTVSISFNWDIEKTKTSLSVFNLPHPNEFFMYSKTFLSSWCKVILNTNSKPDTCFFSFFLILMKKLDSASQRPTNHSIKFVFKDGSGNSLWTPVNKTLISLVSLWFFSLDLKKINAK